MIYIGLAFTAMAAESMLVFTLHVIRSSRVDFIRAALVLKNAKDRTLLNKVLRESLDHAEDMHRGKSVKNAARKLKICTKMLWIRKVGCVSSERRKTGTC